MTSAVAAITPGQALRELTDAVQELSLARSLPEVQIVVRAAARRLTAADGATFVLRDEGKCFYADEDAIEPLWKGMRFPLEACISGWAMINRRPVAIEDIYADDRIPHEAYRPTFVKSLVMVPIRTMDPIGAIGIYWAEPHRATEVELGLARALADSTAVALEHTRTIDELDRSRVAEQEVRRLAGTDPLTGLANRRAWDEALAGALADPSAAVSVAAIDLDGFKRFNDANGHPAGDRVLQDAAAGWAAVLRPGDLLGRYGGDEFVVLLRDCDSDRATGLAERLRAAVPAGLSASIGLAARRSGDGAEALVARADGALYAAKAAGRDRVSVGA